MNRAISIALLIGGVILVIYGINASQSLSSDFSRFFTDSPTSKSIWMLVGGVVLVIVGLLRGSRTAC